MEKEIRKFKVNFSFDWTYGVEIKKLREDLDALEKLGVTEIEIEPQDNWGSPSITIEAFIKRIETEEEFLERKQRVENHNEDIKQRELKQLEKLKQKYGI